MLINTIIQIRQYQDIFSSETTEPISTKLCGNDPWVVPFRHFRPPTKMAATSERNLI